MLKKVAHYIPGVTLAGIVGLVVARIMRRRHEHQSFVHRLLPH